MVNFQSRYSGFNGRMPALAATPLGPNPGDYIVTQGVKNPQISNVSGLKPELAVPSPVSVSPSGAAKSPANVLQKNSNNKNLKIYEAKDISIMNNIVPVVVDSAGYYATGKFLLKDSESLKDVAVFAVADFISLYGLDDWVQANLVSRLGLSSDMINEYLCYLISVAGPIIAYHMLMGNKPEVLYEAMKVSGAFVVDQLYYKIVAARNAA